MLGSVFNRNQGASGVKSQLRSFHLNGKPYGFSEFQGPGFPPAEIGSPGDIYIDTTQGKHALYARYPSEWMEWRGMRAGIIDTSPIPHPDIPSRFLGLVTSSNSISWFTKGKAAETALSNPSDMIATILAGRQEKKRKRDANDTMELAKRMRPTSSDPLGSSASPLASTSTSPAYVADSSHIPPRSFVDSNIGIPTHQPMIDFASETMPAPVDNRLAPILEIQDAFHSHESADPQPPAATYDRMNLPPSLTRKPPDTPVKLDLRSKLSKRPSASGVNKMKISPLKSPPVVPSVDDGILIRQALNLDSASKQFISPVQQGSLTSSSQGAHTTGQIRSPPASGSAPPRLAIQPPTVAAISHTGESFVIDVAAVLLEVIRLREENDELVKIKRDNALLVKLLSSYPPLISSSRRASDSALHADLHGQTQAPMDVPEAAENADKHQPPRLSPDSHNENGPYVLGKGILSDGEPYHSIAEDPVEKSNGFECREHSRSYSPTMAGFEESRGSDQVDELKESESEIDGNEAANGKDNSASLIPASGDARDSGSKTIRGVNPDLPLSSPPSDHRNIDTENALRIGSPTPIDVPIGAEISNSKFDNSAQDATDTFSKPSGHHFSLPPERNMLVVKQEAVDVVSPSDTGKRQHHFSSGDIEIIDLTFDDDDDDSMRDDADAQALPNAILTQIVPDDLLTLSTVKSPNILEQPLKSPATSIVFKEVDASQPSPPVKHPIVDVEGEEMAPRTSIEQGFVPNFQKEPLATSFDDPENMHLLSNDQIHGADLDVPFSNPSNRDNSLQLETPALFKKIEVKEESQTFDDLMWLTTAHLQVIFDQKCVTGVSLCRLCLANEPTKIFKCGSSMSHFELVKHCTDEHWDACETLRNLEQDQLLHIFDNLFESSCNA